MKKCFSITIFHKKTCVFLVSTNTFTERHTAAPRRLRRAATAAV